MLLLQAEHVKIQSSPSVRRFCAIKLITMMTTSASSFALATLSLAWEGIKRCVTNVGASGLTNKKNTNYYFNSTTSFSGSRTRSSSTDFVCVHTRISSTYSRTVVRPMAVPYFPYVVRPMAVPYSDSQNIEPYVSSHERTGMYATR